MFSHITVGSKDLEKAAAFYDAVLPALGLVRRQVEPDGGPPSVCWIEPGQRLPAFYVYQPQNGAPAQAGNGAMSAFLAPSRQAVDTAYAAGLKVGGLCEGKPGERTHYGKGYYGAYLRDPDGNKLHFAYRGDIAT